MSEISALGFLEDMGSYGSRDVKKLEASTESWLKSFRGWTHNIKPAVPNPFGVYESACALMGFTEMEKVKVLTKYYSVIINPNEFFKLNGKDSKERVVMRMCTETLFVPNSELFVRAQLYTQALAQIKLRKEAKRLTEVINEK